MPPFYASSANKPGLTGGLTGPGLTKPGTTKLSTIKPAAVKRGAAESAVGVWRPARVTTWRGPNAGAPSSCVIAVIGGCGGAGASSLAAALAHTALLAGRRVALFDADPLGGGFETLMAAHTVPVDIGGDSPRARPASRRGPDQSEIAIAEWGDQADGHVPVAAVRDTLRELRQSVDLVIVDLPRSLGDGAQLALGEATHSLIVCPVTERAVIATARMLPLLDLQGPLPRLVARLPNQDGLTPGSLATLLSLPLAGTFRPARPTGRGEPAGASIRFGRSSIGRFCRDFLDAYVLPAPRHASRAMAEAAA